VDLASAEGDLVWVGVTHPAADHGDWIRLVGVDGSTCWAEIIDRDYTGTLCRIVWLTWTPPERFPTKWLWAAAGLAVLGLLLGRR